MKPPSPRFVPALLTLFPVFAVFLPATAEKPSAPTHVPADSFLVPDGMEVTIWATSPILYNPTNMDVDIGQPSVGQESTREKSVGRPESLGKKSAETGLASKEELYLDRKEAFANPPKDHPDRPNVLLIGDSISVGYTAYVRRTLKHKADVYRIPTNARNSAYGVKHLDKWLRLHSLEWDVIHFNWGLWDLCYRHPKAKTQGNRDKVNGILTETCEGYRANMEKIVARLKKTDAKLIWCTTTPVPEGEAGRKIGDDLNYNQIAKEIMDAHGIAINDLYSHALLKLPETMVRKGDVHFTEPGYIHLAKKVANEITARLPK